MQVKRYYWEERKLGVRPRQALENAKTRRIVHDNWDDLEKTGLVRVRIEPDDWVDWDDLEGDCYDVELHADSVPGGARTIIAQQKAFRERVERDGVWGYIVEVRCPNCGNWLHLDSCWGFDGTVPEDAYLYAQAEAIRRVTDPQADETCEAQH